MNTVHVKFGSPSEFYYRNKRISVDAAFGMYVTNATFMVGGKKIDLNDFGATVGFDLNRNSTRVNPRMADDEIVPYLKQKSQENRLRAKVEDRLRMERGDWYLVMQDRKIKGAINECVTYFRSVQQDPPDHDVIACLRHKLHTVLGKYASWFVSGQALTLLSMFRYKFSQAV